jgi:signal transduction histidine kinase
MPSSPSGRITMQPVNSRLHRFGLTVVAVVGLFATFGVMIGFDLTSALGAIAFTPWISLIAFDSAVVAGLVSSAVASGLWVIAAHHSRSLPSVSGGEIVVRFFIFAALAVGVGVVGRRLRASEQAYSSTSALQAALIDATLDGICLTDERGNILITNAPLRRIAAELGMPDRGTIAERLLAVADRLAEPERYRQRMLELVTEKNAATSDEFELAGTGRVFRGFTAPVSTPNGAFAGRIWTLREVTADRELDRMRDAFVATVSHELRTPLTSISGFLEMMEDEEAGLGETGRTYLNVIRRSAERLQHLVEDLLLVAQIEARRVELERKPVNLAGLAARAVEAAQPAASERGVGLTFVEGTDVAAVAGDERLLGQVLDNLVSNAVKFTESGGRVTVAVSGNGNEVVQLVVSDTGIGIPPGEQGQVFSRFFRASTATQRAIPGTGLGLAISRALVQQHGGSIVLASEEGRGTQVTVRLPVGT